MKEKILVFIIGLLIGAILSAGGFLAYEYANKNNNTNTFERNDGMQQMMGGQFDGQTPPDKPEGMGDNNFQQMPSSSKTTNK